VFLASIHGASIAQANSQRRLMVWEKRRKLFDRMTGFTG
jgi:hypothetical protein